MNTGLVVIISILALYGLIILGRKIMNRNTPEGKFKGLKYFIEPYSSIGCGCKQTKGGLFNLQTITKCDCCNIDKKKLLSETPLTDKEREALVYCPDFLDECKAYMKEKTGQIPANPTKDCLNPTTVANVAKRLLSK